VSFASGWALGAEALHRHIQDGLGKHCGVSESEARELAQQRLAALRSRSYDALVSGYLGRSTHEAVVGASGTPYDIEIQAFWDKVRTPGNLRVMVAVDWPRKGLRSLPNEDFIITPEGRFVGE
jgi:hypothetical protein